MKYYFIINPASGQGTGLPQFLAEIAAACKRLHITHTIYETRCPGDGERYCRKICETLAEDTVFYACGGDGTVHEVVNGIAECPHAILGILPIGSGNDTIRNFPYSREDFLDLSKQLQGSEVPMDLLQYSGIINGAPETRYCINMFNNGFDCNVVEAAARLKQKPFLSGTGAYIAAIVEMFIRKKGITLEVHGDDQVLFQGPMLLCSVCNGTYCGGGFAGSPQAKIDDGYLDINLILDMSRLRFMRLLPSYQKGTHLDREDAADVISTYRCKTAKLLPYGSESFRFCTDGEIRETTGISISVREHALRMRLPSGN